MQLLSLNTNSKKIRIETNCQQLHTIDPTNALNTNSKKIRIETNSPILLYCEHSTLNTNSKKIRIETYLAIYDTVNRFKYQFQENKD